MCQLSYHQEVVELGLEPTSGSKAHMLSFTHFTGLFRGSNQFMEVKPLCKNCKEFNKFEGLSFLNLSCYIFLNFHSGF